jgi:N-acetylglucosamine-6-phosphate deacetylase
MCHSGKRVTGDLSIVGGSLVGEQAISPGDLLIRGGIIVGSRPQSFPQVTSAGTGVSVLDAAGLLVAPGFIDTQVNGAVGVDLSTEPEGWERVAAALPRYGVTSFVPTVITGAPEVPRRLLTALRAGGGIGRVAGVGSARSLGAHLEGPMLNPIRRGIHPLARLRAPSPALVEGWSAEEGVALVTIAPELPGALAVVTALVDRGVVVAAGHTDATAEELLASVDAGVTHVTHLFNAMRPFHHRDPGPIGVTLGHPTLTAGLIADGVHLHRLTVTAAWVAMGRRLNMVTDAVAALGWASRPTSVGSAAVGVGGVGVVDDDGRLAGGNVGLDQHVRNLLTWTGCSIPDAIATVTSTPADILRRPGKGRLRPGSDGDIVLLARDLQIVATVVGGVVVYDRRQAGGTGSSERS